MEEFLYISRVSTLMEAIEVRKIRSNTDRWTWSPLRNYWIDCGWSIYVAYVFGDILMAEVSESAVTQVHEYVAFVRVPGGNVYSARGSLRVV